MSEEEKKDNKRKRSDDEHKTCVHETQLRLEDIWKHVPVFPIKPAEPHFLYEYNWKFSNLEAAFKEGGLFHGEERVYLFCYADPLDPLFDDKGKISFIPVVVAIVSSTLPSDKLKVIQKGSEEVIGMEKVNMAWVPCVPLGEWASSLPEISILNYAQREATSECFELDPNSEYLPYYYNPYRVDETKQSSVVDIVYTTESGRVDGKFYLKFHGVEGFANKLIKEGKLSSDHKDAFKAFVTQKVKEGKKANNEAMQKHTQDVEELRRNNEEAAAAFEKMRFYKFYPVATPDTGNICWAKCPFINRYYGNAQLV